MSGGEVGVAKGRGRGLSAEVGEHHGLDGHPADGTQLVPLLQLPGAHVAGHEVSGAAVDDAAVLGPRLADQTRVQARVRQPGLGRHAALQLGELLGVGREEGAGRRGLRF